jgi:hypothetical protein
VRIGRRVRWTSAGFPLYRPRCGRGGGCEARDRLAARDEIRDLVGFTLVWIACLTDAAFELREQARGNRGLSRAS